MDEIINPVWNIFEPPLIDRSIRSYEYKQYRENNVVVKNLDRYEITTKNSQSWKHLANAYLFVKANLANEGQYAVTVCNNGLNDFKLARLFYENKLIEEIDYVGIATTVMNLIEFSGDISDSVASQLLWYMDTADTADRNRFAYIDGDKATELKASARSLEYLVARIKANTDFNRGFLERWQLTNGGKTFCKFIPLNRLFRFCREVNKVLKGEIKIVLEKNHLKNILHASGEAQYEYHITDLSLFIPELEPSLNVMATLENQLSLSEPTYYAWNPVQCYRSDVENTTSGTWRVVHSQYKVNAIYIVFSKVARDNNFKETNMVFDHNNLESIQVRVNGKIFPAEEYRCDYTANRLDYSRLYTSFLSAGYKMQDDQGTCVSAKDYALLYPIIAFDLTKQDDDPWANIQASEVEIRWRISEFTENYYIYAVIQSERRAEVNVVDKQIFITI